MKKKLSCHCGGVEAEVSLPNGLKMFLSAIVLFVKKRYYHDKQNWY